ncbi:MAG: ribbon-helix-helix domain-containing protein [Thermoplasmata archaeon]|nr:ribbon-helix-helix domain-containing protein [Thermoplasmata archaeon]MCI4358981.1 ribbon-helix-helix domain-containing protein [Thermoplasmata archaeon]
MFDKQLRRPAQDRGSREPKVGPEDERIALRCNRRELQLVDSFVANGEFRSRSELVRQALRVFLRDRAALAVHAPAAPGSESGLVEVPVRLRGEEIETYRAYGEIVSNGQDLEDLLALLVRRGELELKVLETVARSRASIRDAAEAKNRIRELGRSAEELERRGVVGR